MADERRNLKVGGVVLCGGAAAGWGGPRRGCRSAASSCCRASSACWARPSIPWSSSPPPARTLPPLPGHIAVVRDEEDGRGPLQGLAAGLKALRDRTDAVYLSSCDAPFLRPAFVQRLIELLGDAVVCVPRVGDHYQPLAAVYRVEAIDAVRRLLAANRGGGVAPPLHSLFAAVPTRVVGDVELADVDSTFQTLRNLNTPEEYEAALRELTAPPGRP